MTDQNNAPDSRPPHSAGVSRMRRLIFSIVVLAALGAAGELALRLFHRFQHHALDAKYPDRARCMMPVDDPDLVYAYIPGACGNNAQGYWDYPRTFDKPAGTFRIVLIGDSVAVGDGVDIQDRFGQVLERRLNEKLSYPVELITLARTGYSSSQELVILKNEAFDYGPDLILWSYVLNDPAHPLYHDANGELGQYFYSPRFHLPHFLAAGFFGLKEKVAALSCPDEYHAKLHCVYWPNVESLFATLAQTAAAHQTPIAPILHPVFEKGRDFSTYSLADLHERLDALAAENHLPIIDLLDAYRQYDPDPIRRHTDERFDPWHPNAKGHAVAAEAIERFLLDRRFLPAGPASAPGSAP